VRLVVPLKWSKLVSKLSLAAVFLLTMVSCSLLVKLPDHENPALFSTLNPNAEYIDGLVARFEQLQEKSQKFVIEVFNSGGIGVRLHQHISALLLSLYNNRTLIFIDPIQRSGFQSRRIFMTDEPMLQSVIRDVKGFVDHIKDWASEEMALCHCNYSEADKESNDPAHLQTSAFSTRNAIMQQHHGGQTLLDPHTNDKYWFVGIGNHRLQGSAFSLDKLINQRGDMDFARWMWKLVKQVPNGIEMLVKSIHRPSDYFLSHARAIESLHCGGRPCTIGIHLRYSAAHLLQKWNKQNPKSPLDKYFQTICHLISVIHRDYPHLLLQPSSAETDRRRVIHIFVGADNADILPHFRNGIESNEHCEHAVENLRIQVSWNAMSDRNADVGNFYYALLDFTILTRSLYFIGTHQSTFSHMIALFRPQSNQWLDCYLDKPESIHTCVLSENPIFCISGDMLTQRSCSSEFFEMDVVTNVPVCSPFGLSYSSGHPQDAIFWWQRRFQLYEGSFDDPYPHSSENQSMEIIDLKGYK
jgi:hypothetical protein